jgi:glycosyltransferase involved in cell wall biosynthesis
MITGKNIIVISGVEWDTLWQGSQEIASRLAKAGNRVLYIENVGVRSPTWKDSGRIALRISGWIKSFFSRGVRQVGPGLYVCAPIVMPPFGNRWRRSLNRLLLLPLIFRSARSVGMNDVILWTFLPTDTVLDLISLFTRRSRSIVVYHCTADFSQLTHDALPLRESENALLQLSDLVFVPCRQLAEHCVAADGKVHLIPNGVSFELFNQKNGNGNQLVASNLQSTPPPVIGYIGGLHRFVDFELLAEMAQLRPDWSWIFIGPVQTSVGKLDQLPNVHLLGQKSHESLYEYLRDFDVCIVPYIKSQATATVVPTKINEYLAAGKPVVATELPTVCEFNARHKVLTTAPSQPDHFLRAIEDSLGLPADSEAITYRTKVARLNDWQTHLDAMSTLIEAEITAKGL